MKFSQKLILVSVISLVVGGLLGLAISPAVVKFRSDGWEPPGPGGEKEKNISPPPGEFRPRPPRGRNPHFGFFAKLTDAERAEIEKLARANDRAGLRKKMKELFIKYRPPEAKKVDELSEKYLAAKTETEKTAIKAELEKAVRVQFMKRLEFTRNSISAAGEQLKKAHNDFDRLNAYYKNSLKNSEKIIRERVEQMCLPKAQRKKPPRNNKRMEPPPGPQRSGPQSGPGPQPGPGPQMEPQPPPNEE